MGWVFATGLAATGGHLMRSVANNVGSNKNNHFVENRQGFFRVVLAGGFKVWVEGGRGEVRELLLSRAGFVSSPVNFFCNYNSLNATLRATQHMFY